MKKMKNLIILSLPLAILMASCTKQEINNNSNGNPENAQHLSELTISENFNWSSSSKGSLSVTLNPQNEFYTEGQPVVLLTESGTVLDQRFANRNQVKFHFSLPPSEQRLWVQYPNTGEKMEIAATSKKVQFTVGDIDNLRKTPSGTKKSAKTSSTGNVIVNGDFTDPTLHSGGTAFGLVSPAGKWYALDNRVLIKSVGGNNVISSPRSNYNWAMAKQTIAVQPNAPYTGSVDYYRLDGGRYSTQDFYFELYLFDASQNLLGYRAYSGGGVSGTQGGGTATISGTTPANCAYINVCMATQDGDWLDNFVLDVATPDGDQDGDGIPDSSDDYPTDGARAYASYYPTSGYQTLAFEDLWPAKGDFDFNDLVVSMDVEMAGDTSNNLVDATFTITADAVGSGLSNGLAIVLRDGSGNFLNDNVISSVTGDATADPDVTNGIIVFSDIYAAQESFYMNNGFGPSAPAEEFTFTVSFNANAGSQIIVPEMYIFRSGERGREIHQKGFSATPAADVTLFNTLDDVNGTYSTANGLPWVIELVTNDKSFQHPLEKVDILQAYPQFQNWAESDGQSASDWYINPDELKVF